MQVITISGNTVSTELTSLDISTRFLTPDFDSTLADRVTISRHYRLLRDSVSRRLVNNILVFPLYVMPQCKERLGNI